MPKLRGLSRDHRLFRAIRLFPGLVDSDKETLIILHKIIPTKGNVLSVNDICVLTIYTPETIRKSLNKLRNLGLLTKVRCTSVSLTHRIELTEKFKALGGKK